MISITDFAFTPDNVSVPEGTTVCWENDGNVTHTATADAAGGFDSGPIAPGAVYTHTFATSGSNPYHCSIHPFMTGTIDVTGTPPGWQTVAPLPQDLFGGASATDGTYEYVIGGYSFTGGGGAGATLNTVYRYDPATDTWTTLAPLPQIDLLSAAVYYPPTNKIFVFGGSTRTPDPVLVYNTTWIYDIATDTWTAGPTMPAPRSQMARGYYAANGKIYLNGGYETSTIDSVSAQTWEFDPVAGTFTDKAPSPQAHGGPASGIVDDHLVVAGGRTNPDETLSGTYDYDIATDTWTQDANMPAPTNVPGSLVGAGMFASCVHVSVAMS